MFTDQKRTLLYVALMAITFFLWQAWQKDYPVQNTATANSTASMEGSASLPPLAAQQQAAQLGSASQVPTATKILSTSLTTPAADLISVTTDTINVQIDPRGGNLVQLKLSRYPQSLKDRQQPVILLTNEPSSLHVAQSGLIGSLGPDGESGQALYASAQKNYQLSDDQNTLSVKLTWQNKQGLTVNKIFTFKRGQYDVKVDYTIDNKTAATWSGQLYAQLRQMPEVTSAGFFGLHTYQGGAISSTAIPYEKISFANMEKSNLDRNITGGWLAVQQRYFLSVWVPQADQTNRYYSRYDGNGVYTLGYVGPVLHIEPGKTGNASSVFYAGPEVSDILKKVAPHLNLTIDYGWLSPISQVIFFVMKYIHSVIGNWGWSIVLVTLLIKLVFYRLSATSYRSMAKMRKLAPQLQALKERFGDDRQKMGQATMELYKREKANPLSGCLPMIVQIPFFIALYYVLIESVELRQAPFILWIHDLSSRDPYFVLPILMGISMVFTTAFKSNAAGPHAS